LRVHVCNFTHGVTQMVCSSESQRPPVLRSCNNSILLLKRFSDVDTPICQDNYFFSNNVRAYCSVSCMISHEFAHHNLTTETR
jgi:hypothetical protein